MAQPEDSASSPNLYSSGPISEDEGDNEEPVLSRADSWIAEAQRRQQEEQRRINELTREVRHHFNNTYNFKFDSVVGRGSYGLACRIIQKRYKGRSRKLIIKRALSDRAIAELRHEIEMMEWLNGSAHIASVIATIDDDSPREPSLTRTFRRMRARLRGEANAFLVGLRGPALVLENLEHGTLTSLIRRMQDTNRTLPNRVLWRIFLCLVRACMAMQYPPGEPPGTEPQLEAFPIVLVARSNLAHRDMHTSNILIGTAGDFPEHRLVPPVKLIDFGQSREIRGAAQQNLIDISIIMIKLIRGDFRDIPQQRIVYRGTETLASAIVVDRHGERPYPTLDPELRRLLALCLAVDPTARPTLNDVLDAAQEAVETKDAAWYGPWEHLETNSRIRRIMQELIYDTP